MTALLGEHTNSPKSTDLLAIDDKEHSSSSDGTKDIIGALDSQHGAHTTDIEFSTKEQLGDKKICKSVSQRMNTFANCFGNKDREEQGGRHGVLISGHRGGQGKQEPENTMRAFKKAILEDGLVSIELDVSYSNGARTIFYNL